MRITGCTKYPVPGRSMFRVVDHIATEYIVNEGGQPPIGLGVFEIQHVVCIVLLAVQVDVDGANAARKETRG